MNSQRKIKNVNKSFREYNIRRRGLGQPIVTMEEYLSLRLPVDHRGRINPQIQAGEIHMLQVFGESIYTERKQCIKCKRVKPYADFLCRYKTKKIENRCKACEQERKRGIKAK